jgi:hypothetical protein
MPSGLQRRRLLAGCLELDERGAAGGQHETVWDTRIASYFELPEDVSAGFGELSALGFYVLFHALTYQA